jgi:hypothetical protein
MPPRVERVILSCSRCGQAIHVLASHVKRGKGKYCSRKCLAEDKNDLRWSSHKDNFEQYFWSFVDRRTPGECWPWTGKAMRGYGRIVINGKLKFAHRIALMLHQQQDDPGSKVFACHQCDNPICCNPNHLWWGSSADNVRDAVSKGRMRGNKMPRINVDEVRLGLLNNKSVREISQSMGFHECSVYRAIKRDALLAALIAKETA